LLLACSKPEERHPDIEVANGWTREVARGRDMAAVYLAITNRGEGEDRLLDVRSTAAGAATLHDSSSVGGIARMRPIEGGIALPPKSTVDLKPGGTHIMLTGLKRGLSAGQSVELDLRFTRSGRRSIAIRVVPAAGGDDSMDHGMRM
jgi:copper(I)-binding protein